MDATLGEIGHDGSEEGNEKKQKRARTKMQALMRLKGQSLSLVTIMPRKVRKLILKWRKNSSL